MDNVGLWLGVWYFVGVGAMAYHLMRAFGYLTIGHIFIALLVGSCGPVLLIVLLLDKYSKVVVFIGKKKASSEEE